MNFRALILLCGLGISFSSAVADSRGSESKESAEEKYDKEMFEKLIPSYLFLLISFKFLALNPRMEEIGQHCILLAAFAAPFIFTYKDYEFNDYELELLGDN